MDGHLFNFLLAFLVTAIATPLCRKLAFRLDILDHPGYRKIHKKAMPLLGGLAIFIGLVIPLLVDARDSGTVKIMVGGLIILFLGLLDDKYGMGATVKFMLPSLAALVLIYLGIRTVFLPEIEHNLLNIGFSFLWIMGIVNAFNIIDNMDGLSGGVGFISSMIFGFLGLVTGQPTIAILSFSLAGACLGFLLYNFPPAKIFAGDAGSMLIGFALASISIYASWETPHLTTSLLVPIFALGYPLYDTGFVTILRTLYHKPFWIGDANHTSHRLLKLGFTQRQALSLLFLLSIGLGITSLVITAVSFVSSIFIVGVVVFLLIVLSLLLAKIPFVSKPVSKHT